MNNIRQDITASFYALAYDVSQMKDANGDPLFGTDGTVIAYRGTDNIAGSILSGGGDLLNGWTLGGGLASASQGKLAIEFYNAVRGGSVFDAHDNAITLTGHSLGGGLAGFVGTLVGGHVIGFDHMPFLAATYAAFMTEFRKRAVENGYPEDILPTDVLIEEFGMRRPSFENYRGIALEGEVNRLLRDGTIALVIGGLLGAVPYAGPFLAALGGAVAGGQIAGEQALGGRNSELSTYDWSRRYDDPVLSQDRHSIATLIIAKFAALQEEGNSAFADWRAGGMSELLYTALYEEAIAEAIPETGVRGKDGQVAVSTVRTAIAYSAISEGDDAAKPFGDTAIWSMFNDAGDLGNVLAGDEAAFFGRNISADPGILSGLNRKDIKQYLADVSVQYAGALALYDVEGETVAGVSTHDGVLGLSNDVLAFDASSKLWGEVLKSTDTGATGITGEQLTPVSFDDFRAAYFEQTPETSDNDWTGFIQRLFGFSGRTYDEDELNELVKLGWSKNWGAAIGAANVDRYHMAAPMVWPT